MSGSQKSLLRTIVVGIAAIGIVPIFVGGRMLRHAESTTMRQPVTTLLGERVTTPHTAADSVFAVPASEPDRDFRGGRETDGQAGTPVSRHGTASTWEKVRTLFN